MGDPQSCVITRANVMKVASVGLLVLAVLALADASAISQAELLQDDELTPQSLYEQVSELYEESLISDTLGSDVHPAKRTPTTEHSKGPKKKAASKKPINTKGGKGKTPTAAGKGIKKLTKKLKEAAKPEKKAAAKPKAKAVDEEWPSAVQAVAGITAPTPAQVTDVKATSHTALQDVVNTVIKSRAAIQGASSEAMKAVAAKVTQVRAGIVAVAKKDKATGTKNLLGQMSAFSSSLTPQSLYEMETKMYEESLLDAPKKKAAAKPIKGGKGKTPTAAGKGLKKKKPAKAAPKPAKPAAAAKPADGAAPADKDGGKAEPPPGVNEEWPSAVKAVDDIHAPTPAQVTEVKAASRKALQDVVNTVVQQRVEVTEKAKNAKAAVVSEIDKERGVIVAAVKKDQARGTKNLFDKIDDFRKMTAGEDGDNEGEFSMEEVTSAEFAGHHPTPDQACACCHHFKPTATCYSMKCGDGSGDFCWSPTQKGIHWGWGTIGKKSYRNGASECTSEQKAKVCLLPCVAQGTC